MTKHLYTLLLCLLFLPLFSQESITLTLNPNDQPEFIHLTITANGEWKIEGVKEETALNGSKNYYTPTSQQITIKGEITTLDCSDNSLVALSLEKASHLQKLWCFKNAISSLDVSTHPDLLWLNCYENKLQSLTLGNNPKLQRLYCYDNELSVLDLSQAKNLMKLSCANNQLTAIDIRELSSLRDFSCNQNKIKELDLSKSQNLTSLWCNSNEITSLNLTTVPLLGVLDCGNNRLTSLDLSSLSELLFLWCNANQLSELDLSHTPKISNLNCSNNLLSVLDLSSNKGLWVLNCADNQIKEMDLSLHLKLTDVLVARNKLTTLKINTEAIKLRQVECFQNELSLEALSSLIGTLPPMEENAIAEIVLYDSQSSSEKNDFANAHLEALKAIGWKPYDYNGGEKKDLEKKEEPYVKFHTNLEVGSNITLMAMNADFTIPEIEGITTDSEGNMVVTSQDITLKGDLYSLLASDIQITSIDVSHAPNLAVLFVAYNQLTTIDLSKNGKLETLVLSDNQLSNITWGSHLALKELYLYNNRLTQLDLSTFINLESLSVSENQLSALNLEKNRQLKELLCARMQLSELDLTNNVNLELLDISSNAFTSLSVNGLNKLKKLYLYQNQISLASMQQLLSELPQREEKDKALVMVIDSQSSLEKNQFSKELLKMIAPKNWNAYDFKGGINEGNGELLNNKQIIPSDTKASFVKTEEGIFLFKLPPRKVVRLLSLEGTILFSTYSTREGQCTIATTSLPEGIYILDVDNHPFKIAL